MANREIQETSSIRIEMEIEGDNLNIMATVKDPDVFPPVDWANKQIRARLLTLAANQVMVLMSQRFSAPGGHKIKMISVVCQGCGKMFEIEQSCCGEKEKQVQCPHCGKPQLLIRGKRATG